MLEEFKGILQQLLEQYHARKTHRSMVEQLRQRHSEGETGPSGQPPGS